MTVWQTLFPIPHDLFGLPLFGMGWLLGIWAVVSIPLIGWLTLHHGWTPETRGHAMVLGMIGLAIAFLLPRLEDQAPNGEPIGLLIRGYGVMLLLGVVGGIGLAVRRARRMGVHPDHILSLAFWMFVVGITGARLFYVVTYWDQFAKDNLIQLAFDVVNVAKGGLVVHGSLIGGLVAAIVYLHRNRLPTLAIADLIAPSMVLGLALGRVGCLMNGCCFGDESDHPWSITFPRFGNVVSQLQRYTPPYEFQLSQGILHRAPLVTDDEGRVVVGPLDEDSAAAAAGLRSGDRVRSLNGHSLSTPLDASSLWAAATSSVRIETADGRIISWELPGLPERSRPVHPTQIYSAINAGLLCLLLVAIYPFRRRDGEVFAIGLALYAITRFVLEFLRADELSVGGQLTYSQPVSVTLLVLAAVLWAFTRRQPQGSALPASPRDEVCAT